MNREELTKYIILNKSYELARTFGLMADRFEIVFHPEKGYPMQKLILLESESAEIKAAASESLKPYRGPEESNINAKDEPWL